VSMVSCFENRLRLRKDNRLGEFCKGKRKVHNAPVSSNRARNFWYSYKKQIQEARFDGIISQINHLKEKLVLKMGSGFSSYYQVLRFIGRKA